jgi:hypothetical protein
MPNWMNDRSEIVWAPRVSLSKIRELYLQEARGTCNDELLDEVGFSLYSRCQSIFEFSEAVSGWVKCKRCAQQGNTIILLRITQKPDELLHCPTCGWQVRWRVYLAESEKVDGQLDAGHAGAAFQRYINVFPQSRSAEEKMLAIDRLIHEFHWILIKAGEEPEPHKPAGVNLLRGSATQVIDLLNDLTYGENTPPELLEARAWWLAQKPIARRQKRNPAS